MSTPPIKPSRIIPPGQPLPTPWTPPPAGPPSWGPPPPGPAQQIVVQHVHTIVPPAPPPPPPRFEWSRLWSWVQGRHWIGACVALAPLFGGRSLATGWGAELQQCRTEASVGGAWCLALIVLVVTWAVARWRPRWYTAALATTALFGLAAQASPFDLITALTGVTK